MKLLFTVLLLSPAAFSQVTGAAEVPGPGRDDAAACFAAGQAYILSGNLANGFSESNRMYRYDVQSDHWSETASFPGEPRQYAAIFVVNDQIYFGLGISAGGQLLGDFWKFDPAAESWYQLKDFPGQPRSSLFCETDGFFGYLGTGLGNTGLLKDCWKYIPQYDHWQPLPDFPGAGRREAVAFSLFGNIYAGLGFTNIDGTDLQHDFFRYDPQLEAWQQIADFPGGERAYAVAADNGAFGLVGTGYDGAGLWQSDLYRYNAQSDTWKELDTLPVPGVRGMSAFSDGNDIFLLTGTIQGEGRSSKAWKMSLNGLVNFNVYPNPSDGNVTVVADRGTVELFDLNGKLIRSAEISDCYQRFSDIGSGMYIVKYTHSGSDAHPQVRKLVVAN